MAKLVASPKAAEEEAPLPPWRQVLALALCQGAHAYTLGSLFSYAGLLCVDLGWAADADAAGYTAGYLAGALTFGRIFTSVAWGKAADAYGVRPTLVASCVNIALGNLLFGCARRLPLAMLARCLFLGAGNGLVTLQGPACYAIGGSEHQVYVFGKVFAAAGAIQVLAPSLAGFAYNTIPHYPAFVPALGGVALGLVAAIVAHAWLPAPPANRRRSAAYARVVADDDVDEAGGGDGATDDGDATEKGDAIDDGAATVDGDAPPPSPSFASALFARPVVLVTLMRMLLGWLLFASFEVIPLWTISSRRLGGLGWNQRRLGLMLGLASVNFTLWMYFCVPRVVAALKVRRGAVAAAAWLTAALALTPEARSFLFCLAGWASIMMGTSTLETVLVAATNNSIPERVRGAVTGVITMVEAVAKCVGPPSASTLYAFSIDDGNAAPLLRVARRALGHRLAFYALGAAAAVVGAIAAASPRGVEAPEPPEERPDDEPLPLKGV